MRYKFPYIERTHRPFPIVPGGISEPHIKRVQSIVQAACEVLGVPKHEVFSERRSVKIVRARQIVHWIACRCTSASFPEIGRRLGGQDHSTCVHGFRKIDSLLDADIELAFEIQRVILRSMQIEVEEDERKRILVSEFVQANPVVEPEPIKCDQIIQLRSRGYTIKTISAFLKVPQCEVAKHLGFREVRS